MKVYQSRHVKRPKINGLRGSVLKKVALIFVIGFLSIGSPLFAQYNTTQVNRLTSNNRNADDNYGKSVAISGDYMAVGSPGHTTDTSGANSVKGAGAVFIHGKNQGGTGTWGIVKKITAYGTNSRIVADGFGQRVAMYGDILVVSSNNGYDASGANFLSNAGSVWVYYRNKGGTGNWGLVIKIVSSGTNGRIAADSFGRSISISGTTLIVGSGNSYGAQGGSFLTDAGSAFIFSKNQGGTDNWGLVKKIVGTGTNGRIAGDLFGGSVSIYGDRAVVGAVGQDYDSSGANQISSDPGAAFIFSRDQGGTDNWGLVKKLTGNGTNGRLAFDYFGSSVSIDGHIIVVGAEGQDYDQSGANMSQDAGAAFVFHKDNGGTDNWGFVKKLIGQGTNGRNSGDQFGSTVSVSGSLIMVSAPFQDYDKNGANIATNCGAAYLFYRNIGGSNNWGIVNKISQSGTNARGNNEYSEANAISGNMLVFGCYGSDYDVNGAGFKTDAGAAFLFQLGDIFYGLGTWTPFAPDSTTGAYSCQIFNGTLTLDTVASVANLTIDNGVTLTLNGNVSVDSIYTNNGVTLSTHYIDLTGTTSQSIYGTGTTERLRVSNSAGATIVDSLKINNLLTPKTGALTTNGKLRILASSPTSYGRIAQSFFGGTISGTVIVEKVLSNTNAGWRQIGIPLNTTIGNLSGIDLLGTSHGKATERNIYYWSSDIQFGNTAVGWVESTVSTDNYTRAYTIYGNNNNGGLHDIALKWTITGIYVSGDQSFSLGATNDPNAPGTAGSEKTGWNLIPNPYVGNLKVSSGSAFWGASGFPSYKCIHVWDAINGQYVGICSTGVTMIQYNNSGTTVNPTCIAPFQAFWVKASSSSTFVLTDAMRINESTGVGTYMKREISTVRVNITDEEGDWDQLVMYEHENGNSLFSEDLDAYKRFTMNTGVPSIYHSTPTGEKASIKSFSQDVDSMDILLSFRNEGSKTLKLFLDLDEMSGAWKYYLKDIQANTLREISNWDTLEIAVSGTMEGRYALVMKRNMDATSVEPVSQVVSEVEISGDGHYAFVRGLDMESPVQYEVVNMQGVSQFSGALKPSSTQGIIDLSNLAPGVYIIRLPELGVNAKVINAVK